jgi:hypothetical protein
MGTRTYAILEVSPAAYAEIRGALEKAGYEHAFHDDVVDMHGIALKAAEQPKHYPNGMGEESRRLHREYNALVAAQRAGAKNGAEVVRVTDEAAAKGIILVPNGENL